MSTQGNWLESFIIEKSKLIEYFISHDSHLFENEKFSAESSYRLFMETTWLQYM